MKSDVWWDLWIKETTLAEIEAWFLFCHDPTELINSKPMISRYIVKIVSITSPDHRFSSLCMLCSKTSWIIILSVSIWDVSENVYNLWCEYHLDGISNIDSVHCNPTVGDDITRMRFTLSPIRWITKTFLDFSLKEKSQNSNSRKHNGIA